MNDLKKPHKSEIASLQQLHKDNFADTLEKHKTLLAEFKNVEDERDDLRRGCKMQQDEITQLRHQQQQDLPASQQSSSMTEQLSARNLGMLMAEQAQTQRLSLQLNDGQTIHKAETRAAQAESESLAQQLSDINERVKELNRILAEKDADVEQVRRKHVAAMSKKTEENDVLSARLKSLTEQSCELSFSRQRLVEDKEDLETKILSLEGEVRATKFLNEMFMGQRERVETALKKLQDEFDSSQAEKQNLAEENEGLRVQVKALQDALRTQNNGIGWNGSL
jgi:chromosome segregation ATPase